MLGIAVAWALSGRDVAEPPAPTRQPAASSARTTTAAAAKDNFLAVLEAPAGIQKKLNALASEFDDATRITATACVESASKAMLYQHVALVKPFAASATLEALALPCFAQVVDASVAAQERDVAKERARLQVTLAHATKYSAVEIAEKQAAFDRKEKDLAEISNARANRFSTFTRIFTVLAGEDNQAENIVNKVVKLFRSVTRSVTSQSAEIAAFRLLNPALQEAHDETYSIPHWMTPAAVKKQKAITPTLIKFIWPDRPAESLVLKATTSEVRYLASLCALEGDSIKDGGIKSCAATALNRWAFGDPFGRTLQQVLLTGGFEALQNLSLAELPPPTMAALDDVNSVIQGRNNDPNFDRTYGGALFFEETLLTQQRGSDFGTAFGFIGTVGNRNSYQFHDLHNAHYNVRTGVLEAYGKVPEYRVVVTPNTTREKTNAPDKKRPAKSLKTMAGSEPTGPQG